MVKGQKYRSEPKRYHVLYKTTCTVTGNFYVGVHSTENVEDDYLGSGFRLQRSIQRHGKENHVREILEIFETKEEMYDREREVVNEETLKNPLCMNLRKGGEGGFGNEEHRKKFMNRANLNRAQKCKEKGEFYQNMCKVLAKNRESNWEKGKYSHKGVKNPFAGRTHSEETIHSISEKMKTLSKGEKNSQFGTIWMTNGASSVKIKRELEESYLAKGWKRGREKKKFLRK